MNELIQDILNNPLASLAVVGNLIVIESLLSVDNAAVLATMVMDLPKEQRSRALRYGIIGAYFFRGVCLLLAAWIIKIWWLKPLGGLYLLYLVWAWWRGKQKKAQEAEGEQAPTNKEGNRLYKVTVGALGSFWATVALVEIMDLAFSIDNVFAAVAFSDNIILICLGVFIGILAMRFVAQGFVKLMEKYAFLEDAAFIVIAILGIKLMLSLYEYLQPQTAVSKFLGSHAADWGVSILTISIFIIPIVYTALFRKSKP
jgi:YkoY family integral membrane protein